MGPQKGYEEMRWKIPLHLEAWACELQAETITNVDSSGKIAAPVSSRQFPRESRMANLTPSSTVKNSNPFPQEMGGEFYIQY